MINAFNFANLDSYHYYYLTRHSQKSINLPISFKIKLINLIIIIITKLVDFLFVFSDHLETVIATQPTQPMDEATAVTHSTGGNSPGLPGGSLK